MAIRKGHAWQSAVAARRKQTQRVPSLSPGITNPGVVFQNHERERPSAEVIADRQAGLTSPDDHSADVRITHLVSYLLVCFCKM